MFLEQDMVVIICFYSNYTNISKERSIVEITCRCHIITYEIAIVIIRHTVKLAFIVYAGTDENMNKLLLTNSTYRTPPPPQKKKKKKKKKWYM